MSSNNNKPETNQGSSGLPLSSLNILALSFGCIIGWGSFAMPGTTFLPVAGTIGTAIAIVIGTFLFIVIGKTYAYMIEKSPGEGGIYGMVMRTLDKPHAFLTLWSLIFSYFSLLWVNTLNFSIFTRFFTNGLLQWGHLYSINKFDIYLGEVFFEMGILVFFALLIAFSRKLVRILINCFFITLYIIIVFLFISIITTTDFSVFVESGFGSSMPAVMQIYNILLFVPWMFVGFGIVSFDSKDYHFPIKRIRILMPLAILLGGLDYLMLNTIAASAVPEGFSSNAEYIAALDTLEGKARFPVLYVVSNKLGSFGTALLGIAITCALSSSIIGFYKVLANMLRSLANTDLFPKRYAKLSSNGIPRRGIFLVLALSILMPFIGKNATGWLTDSTSIGATIAYAYISFCCLKVAKKNRDNRHYIQALVSFIFSLTLFLLPLLTAIFFDHVFDVESYFVLAIWGLIGYGLTVIVSEREEQSGKLSQ